MRYNDEQIIGPGMRPSCHPDAATAEEAYDRALLVGKKEDRRYRSVRGKVDHRHSTKAKLTLEQVRWARVNWDQAPGGTMTVTELARRCGITRVSMSNVVNRVVYKDIE